MFLPCLFPVTGNGETPLEAPPTDAAGRPLTGAELDPVIGSVDGRLIYLSDLARMARTLPDEVQALPFETVMP